MKHTSPIDKSAALADAVESSSRFRFALHREPTSSRAGNKEASVASCVGRETAREACGSESPRLTGAQNPAANVVSFEITGCFTCPSDRALLIYGYKYCTINELLSLLQLYMYSIFNRTVKVSDQYSFELIISTVSTKCTVGAPRLLRGWTQLKHLNYWLLQCCYCPTPE